MREEVEFYKVLLEFTQKKDKDTKPNEDVGDGTDEVSVTTDEDEQRKLKEGNTNILRKSILSTTLM